MLVGMQAKNIAVFAILIAINAKQYLSAKHATAIISSTHPQETARCPINLLIIP